MTEVKLDWMPITWEKLLAGTHDFDAAELGGYILLIARQWEKGFLPNDEKRLMKIARQRSKEKMKTILEKFIDDGNGNLINRVCHETRQEQVEKYLRNSSNGKNGAKKRWQKDGGANSPPISVANDSAITDKKKEEIRDTNVSNQQHTHDDFAKKIFTEECDLDRVNIELQLTPRRLLHELDVRQFNAHLQTENKTHKKFEHWKSHLRNWLNTKPKLQKINPNANIGNQNEQNSKIGRISKATITSYLSRRENNGDSQSDTGKEGTSQDGIDLKRA